MKIITKTGLFGGFILSVLNGPEELCRAYQYLNSQGKIALNPIIIDSNESCAKILQKLNRK